MSTESTTSELVFAFDLGKGSLGEAVRRGNEFLHVESLLIPQDFAETKTAANRRRQKRTRDAHKQREHWLNTVLSTAGMEVLSKRTFTRDPQNHKKFIESSKADYRLEREFAPVIKADGKPTHTIKDGAPLDPTICYTSSLLRIKLLRGEKLEQWQVYKALHSAIQKRGYGKVPWASKEANRLGLTVDQLEEKERKDLEKKDPAYREASSRWGKFKQRVNDPQFHYPCYYDAYHMKLWSPENPHQLKSLQDHNAESTRQVRFDHADVEKEVHDLALKACIQYPQLTESFEIIKREGWKQGKTTFPVIAQTFAEFLVHGPAGKPPERQSEQEYFRAYLQHRKQVGIHPGSNDDWMGAVSQKTPRFDNRIINDCCLIPRFNVCKSEIKKDSQGNILSESLLPSEVTFLMKLKNMRVEQCGQQRGLTAKEIGQIFNDTKRKPEKLSCTETEWKKWCNALSVSVLPTQKEVKNPKSEGRSRFSRPALRILKELILSGKTPQQLRQEIIEGKALPELKFNTDPKKGVVETDLQFLQKMGDTWEGIFIPSQSLDALEQAHESKEKAIRALIGKVNDPIVRHRLTVFADRLKQLHIQHGTPTTLALEFVREDFMGEKAKTALSKFQKDREKQRKEAQEKAQELGFSEKSARLKFELWKMQAGRCIYTDISLPETNLDDYEVEHIVPRSQGGPDAMLNYVLTTKEVNAEKDSDIPYDWFHKKRPDQWDSYKNRVESLIAKIGRKRASLLVEANASELVDKYTALVETAWIAKLSQKIADIYFGWKNGNDSSGNKRITVVSGGLTGRIRRRYKINHILATEDMDDDEAEKKNRKDDRHHALDAMIISFIPQWSRNAKKERFFRFPDGIHSNPQGFFANQIQRVQPRNLFLEKATLAETIYGKRGDTIVQRVSVRDLAYKKELAKETYSLDKLRGQIPTIRDGYVRNQLANFLSSENNQQNDWTNFCNQLRYVDNNGNPKQRILKVWTNVGDATEYKDMSKNQAGNYRKGKQAHKGQFVYLDAKNRPRVRPIYVFESEKSVEADLADQGFQPIGFFQSGCMVELTQKVEGLDEGKYLLNTIMQDGRAVITDQKGNKSKPIALSKLFDAGFQRIA